MSDEFNFRLHTDMYYGIGYSKKLGDLLYEKGFRSAMFLVDEGVAKSSPYFDEIIHIVGEKVPIISLELLRGTEEPDYDYLDIISDKVRAINNVDIIVGIGGGSCLDIAKAVAVLRTNPGKGIDYRGFDKVVKPGIPTFAIPSTAGTGSEVTINAVFTDKKELRKLGINGRYMNATYAILDTEWTISCPLPVAVSSGMDAITHALESFMCRKANSLTRALSKEAFRLLYSALPSLTDDPKNRLKRQELLLGSYLAGAALFNAGSGIAGALSYPIGVNFKVPHGIAGGIFLGSVLEYNVLEGYLDYAQLFDIIELNCEFSPQEKNRRFVDLMKALFRKLGVPHYLNEWGITKENIGDLTKLIIPLQPAFDQNPVTFSSEKDAIEILKKHIRYQ